MMSQPLHDSWLRFVPVSLTSIYRFLDLTEWGRDSKVTHNHSIWFRYHFIRSASFYEPFCEPLQCLLHSPTRVSLILYSVNRSVDCVFFYSPNSFKRKKVEQWTFLEMKGKVGKGKVEVLCFVAVWLIVEWLVNYQLPSTIHRLSFSCVFKWVFT